jgi:hypothetical protein
VRAIAISCASVKSFGEIRGNWLVVGDNGDRRGIESEGGLFWGRGSDKRVRENVLSRVVREGGGAAVNLIHERADPREVRRGSGFVVEEGVMLEGRATRRRRRFI